MLKKLMSTMKDKFNDLVDTLTNLGKKVQEEEVLASEAKEEVQEPAKEETVDLKDMASKTTEIHEYLFTDKPAEEPTEAKEEVKASEPEVKEEVVAESISEEPVAEAPVEDTTDYKAEFEKAKGELDAYKKAEADAEAKAKEFKHNPEAEVKKGPKMTIVGSGKDTYQTPQDRVYAALQGQA